MKLIYEGTFINGTLTYPALIKDRLDEEKSLCQSVYYEEVDFVLVMHISWVA